MKTKHLIVLLLLILMGASAFAPKKERDGVYGRAFSGKITYTVLLESKCPMISTRELQEMFGNTMVMYIENGRYRMVYNGSYIKEELYLGDENKNFVWIAQNDSLLWRNCKRNDSKTVKTSYTRGFDYILDRQCDGFSITTDWASTTYIYDPDMFLDPASFSQDGFEYFNRYLRKARAPFLKYVYDGPIFKKTLIATEVEETDLDDDVFRLIDLPVATSGL